MSGFLPIHWREQAKFRSLTDPPRHFFAGQARSYKDMHYPQVTGVAWERTGSRCTQTDHCAPTWHTSCKTLLKLRLERAPQKQREGIPDG
ncbi:hypothetical protein PRtIB026_A17140 [Pseudomonas sp. RtIB026]|nr:hypothetical protein PRtIB026_A17140 [Pseudomonas sp. RtIB026]